MIAHIFQVHRMCPGVFGDTKKTPSPISTNFQVEKKSPLKNPQHFIVKNSQALILKSKRLTKERLTKSGEVDGCFLDHRRVLFLCFVYKEIHVFIATPQQKWQNSCPTCQNMYLINPEHIWNPFCLALVKIH